MIHIDRKIARSILRHISSYSDFFFYESEADVFFYGENHKESFPVPVPSEEVIPSLGRLTKAGFLTASFKLWGVRGVIGYSITPKLKHHFAFALDQFTKKFFCGFLTGVLTTVVGGVLLNLLIKFLM